MKKSNPKVMLITIGLFLLMSLIILNVIYVGLSKKHLRTGVDVLAFQQNKADMEVMKIGKRGTIYDRNGEVIAQDIERYQLYLVLDKTLVSVGDNRPLHVVDVDRTVEVLHKHTGIPIDEAKKLLANPNAKQIEIGTYGKSLTKEVKEAIEAEELPGIRFRQVMERAYPTPIFASNILGFARYNNEQNRIVGEMGLESYLDEYLKGENGIRRYTIGKKGQVIPGQEQTIKKEKDGNDVYLTIDKNTQSAVSDLVSEDDKFDRWAVVMNAKTGEILGIDSSNHFDLNKKDIEKYTNLVADVSYEPGSVSKVFTYAAAIDSGNFDESKKVQSGSFHVGLDAERNPVRLPSSANAINTIRDAFNGNYGEISYKEGLARSTNTTAIDLLVNHMGTKLFEEYLDRFKLYQDVNIPGISSVTGVKNMVGPLEAVNTSFGQGSSTTALNLVQGFSSIVNDGIMSKPYIINYVMNPTTKEIKLQTKQEHTTILKKSTAEKMNELLRAPVEEEYGTVHRYRLNDLKILGKSGTAEVVENGRYSDSTFINSIMIAAPADNPQIIVYYAQKSGVFGRPNTEKLKSVIKVALDNLQISRRSQVKQNTDFKESEMPSLINHTLTYALDKLSQTNTQIIQIGNGETVIDQYPLKNDPLVTNRKVFISTGGAIKMPDMKGWTYKEVATFSRLSGIGITIKGSGSVESQNVEVNTTLTNESQVEVVLK